MRDPQQAIRNAYLALLQGKITHNGQPVRVYADFIPSNAQMPFVYLSQQTVSTNLAVRACQSWDTTILVEVRMQTVGDLAQTSQLNDMVAQVFVELSGLPRLISEFEVNRHYLESSNTLQEEVTGGMIHRRLLRFRDLVFETVTP